MYIDNRFNFGEIVYLLTDTDQRPYMVLEIYINVLGLSYKVASGANEYTALEMELTREKTLHL